MKENVKYVSRGIGLGGWMFLVFLVLKLTGVIGWSWWWITAPLWGGIALTLAVLALMAVLGGAVALVAYLASLGGK